MAADFRSAGRKRFRKCMALAPRNVYVIDSGRRYRVCYQPRGDKTAGGRVLMVMLQHKHKEQALGQARRAGEIIRLAAKEHALELQP